MKSQQKKSERIAVLEVEVAELRQQVAALQAQISTLQSGAYQRPTPQPWTWPRVQFGDCQCPSNTVCGNVACPRSPRITSSDSTVHGVGTVTSSPEVAG